ncbi:MAG: zinc-dependent alcohol dehydrogenase [Solirubrobacterales bacterium]
MLAAVTRGVRKMEVMEVPEPPPPGPGEVIVHPDAVGICGSDFHFFAGELQIFDSSPYPRVQGHELTGIVEQVGPGTSRVGVGDRVSVMPISGCGSCYPCRVGRGNVCDDFSLVGIHTDGGLQEKLRVPESQLFPIAAEPEVAALAEPFSIAVRTINRSRIQEGERVVVLGAGPIGQAVHLLAGDRGASTLLVDRLQSRLELGAASGAEGLLWESRDQVVEACREWAGGEGPPLVVDATGAPDPIRAAVDMVASAGRVVVVGMSGEEVPLRIGTFTEKELDLRGVSCCDPEEFAEAVRFVERHQELPEPLISRSFPLERAPEALAYAMEHPAEVIKVVITSGAAT